MRFLLVSKMFGDCITRFIGIQKAWYDQWRQIATRYLVALSTCVLESILAPVFRKFYIHYHRH